MTQVAAEMPAAEVLHWVERLGIRHRLQRGAFVTAALVGDVKPGLRASIEAHADDLAALLAKRKPEACPWCHAELKPGARYVRVYTVEGERLTFHPQCQADRAEKNPQLPTPEILFDFPGYTVISEDDGTCSICVIGEARFPEECPSLCRRCWNKQDAKTKLERQAAAA